MRVKVVDRFLLLMLSTAISLMLAQTALAQEKAESLTSISTSVAETATNNNESFLVGSSLPSTGNDNQQLCSEALIRFDSLLDGAIRNSGASRGDFLDQYSLLVACFKYGLVSAAKFGEMQTAISKYLRGAHSTSVRCAATTSKAISTSTRSSYGGVDAAPSLLTASK